MSYRDQFEGFSPRFYCNIQVSMQVEEWLFDQNPPYQLQGSRMVPISRTFNDISISSHDPLPHARTITTDPTVGSLPYRR